MSIGVNVTSRGSPYVALLRLRTAANGNVARVFVNNTGVLWIKSDVSGQQISSSTQIGTGWHQIELCGTVGTTGPWSLYRDGVPIVSSWTTNTGTTPIGRIEIGDTLAKTFTANFDDVVVIGAGGPAPTERPNILIFLTDDQRATDTMTPEVMPRLRQWIMQAGAQFTNFFGTTPLCCPDRSVFLSGRYAHNTGVRTNTDTANFNHNMTMERLLQQAGYRTAYVGKFLNGWQTSTAPPFFNNRALVGGGYANQWFNVDGIGRQVSYTTDFIGEQSVEYLEQFESSDSQPWMMVAATPAPHNPWQPSAEHANDDVGTWAGNPATQETDRSDKPPWVRSRNFSLTQAEVVRVPQLRTLRSVDDMVDTVMTRLQQLGELSDTLVIYTSDNGYLWSEHHLGGDYGTAAQKRYPYAASVKIPFLIRWDGHVTAGSTDQRLAGMIDIVPTVLDAAGVTPDYAVDGYSLLTTHARARIILEYWLDPGDATIPTWVSVRTANLMFVEYYDALGNVSFREYYDLAADPWELINLLNDGDPANPDIGQLQEYVTNGATCAGSTESTPMPPNPCP
jgi:arylsulfatase A-like enzyme